MKRLLYAAASIAALALPLAGTATAQDRTMTKTLTGEQKTVTATVEAIERSTRSVTLKETNGDYNEIYVPTDVKRFDTLKVGDKITAKYYENIVLRLKLPGEKATDTDTAALTRARAKAGHRGAAHHYRDDHRDRSEGAVDRVQQPRTGGTTARASRTRRRWQGDRRSVDITWTMAVLISAEAPK